jgi:triosephosphate isomerase
VIVVYEPTWATGADGAAPVDQVGRVPGHLNGVLRELGASGPEVVYGGTVDLRTVGELARLEALDGVGATRATLDAPGFLAVGDQLTSTGAP